MKRLWLALCLAVLAQWSAQVFSAPAPHFAPPRQAALEPDKADLTGTQLIAAWRPPAGPPPAGYRLVAYACWTLQGARAGGKTAPKPTLAGVLQPPFPGSLKMTLSDLLPGRKYTLRVDALYGKTGQKWLAPDPEQPKTGPPLTRPIAISAQAPGAVAPVGKLYDPSRTNILVGVLLIAVIFLLALAFARKREMYIRPIAGLQAVSDAIGRATEMGKPILYVAGLGSLGDIATIAAMLILGHLARRTAAYETEIIVPCADALVMTAQREIVREAYMEAGRPDAYNQDNIFYVTDSQFGYVAAVDGIMLRERPAAIFFMGYFAAEALILAETGNYVGAIQIAGTDADTQLPFFITACDYTLMGEELYAASAYLSRAPLLLAQLKSQDIGKAIMMALITLGVIGATIAALTKAEWLTKLIDFFNT